MISHERALELISARMDAPLTPAEHRELQGHLAACAPCRVFVTQADELARGLHAMPRYAPSPDVSRAVLAAVYEENGGWLWLQRALQALSSPGLAVASAAALVLALTGALVIALNGPGGSVGVAPEATIEVAEAPRVPAVLPTPPPTKPPAPEPTATRSPARTIVEPTRKPEQTPAPRPTATSVPIVAAQAPVDTTGTDAPPETVDQPAIEPVSGDQTLAMATDDTGSEAAPEAMAQDAEDPALAQDVQVVEESADNGGNSGGGDSEKSADRKGGRKDGADKTKEAPEAAAAEAPAEPVPTHEIAPVILPREAITAMEEAGTAPNDVLLPPPPMDPMLPPQDFLPVTPTPVSDGTPTPETGKEESAPQLVDASDDLGVTALIPEEPVAVSNTDAQDKKDGGKRDKSSKEGKSHEEQQAAYVSEPMSWWSDGVEMSQVVADPLVQMQTAEEPIADGTTGEAAADPAADPAAADAAAADVAAEPERQIDPATGLEIDPVSGLLIDPATGYLIDVANGRIVDPRTGYVVDPRTGLLIEPATGALLDPNTLAIVVPAGFGSDQPAYTPGDPNMRSSIETVVDDTYDDATYKVVPATDGPVQPVGEIVVPTSSGDSIEIQ